MQIISKTKDNLGFEHSLFNGLNWKIKKTEKNITNSRQYILSQFVEEINKSRKGTKYGSLTPIGIKRLCIKINAHPDLRTQEDLEDFFEQCKASTNFNACCYSYLPKDKKYGIK